MTPKTKWQNVCYEVIVRNYIVSSSFNGAINLLKDAYHRIGEASKHTDVDYRSADNRFAYLYRNGTLHSTLVEYLIKKYLQAARNNGLSLVDLLLLKKKSFKICSLGGGPGCDAVGMKEAIRNELDFSGKIDTVIVDKYSEWKSIFCELSEVKGGTEDRNDFVVADLLTETGRSHSQESIRRADIVCLVKFVSVIMHKNCEECINLIEFILDEMSSGKYLLFIDSAGGGFLKRVMEIVQRVPEFDLCYRKEHVKFHIKKATGLLKSLHHSSIINGCRVSIAIWRKSD